MSDLSSTIPLITLQLRVAKPEDDLTEEQIEATEVGIIKIYDFKTQWFRIKMTRLQVID